MRQGDELIEKKDLAGALKVYQAGHAIVRVATTGLAVANTLHAMGQLIEAREAALEVTRMPRNAKEPKSFSEARADALRLADDLEGRIPSVEVTIKDRASVPDVKVVIDNVELPSALIGLPRKLNPGGHSIVITASGFKPVKEDVSLLEKDKKVVAVALVRTESPGVSSPARSARALEQPAAAPPAKSSPSALAYVGFAVGGVGLAVGGVTGILSLNKASTVKSRCDGTLCPTSVRSDADASKSLATVSNISFGIGLVGVVVGVVGMLSTGRATSSSSRASTSVGMRIAPVIGPTELGLIGQF
jgi:hypothetical protein